MRDYVEMCITSSSPDGSFESVRPRTTHSRKRPPLEVFVDGPHGAPSSAIFAAEHAVLVATGIGVTPFAAILKSIMYRYWQSKNTCPRCSYRWSDGLSQGPGFRLRKVDFVWINREQRTFEWFLQLLSQLEMQQAEQLESSNVKEKFLDIHLYITSVLPVDDFKAVTLHLALDLMHKKVDESTLLEQKSFYCTETSTCLDQARSHHGAQDAHQVWSTELGRAF